MEMYYDGKKEFIEFLENGGSESSIKRWIQYILSSKKIDIDVSKWAMDNYVRKYDFSLMYFLIKLPNEVIVSPLNTTPLTSASYL